MDLSFGMGKWEFLELYLWKETFSGKDGNLNTDPYLSWLTTVMLKIENVNKSIL